MAGHRSFNTLLDEMSPERRARIEEGTRRLAAEMLLAELETHSETAAAELGSMLGVDPPAPPADGARDDLPVATLSHLVERFGGRLELIAHMPNGEIRITEFDRNRPPAATP